jgi:16S rRNA (guanine(966)-N(2))-methyltransferase RsmD
MRIVAGKFRSRRIRVGPPPGTRPTSDKLRETLFNILGTRVIESKFLDAYAGVGAIGIEAVSRGAGTVTFVDSSARACAAIRANLADLRIEGGFRVVQSDLVRALARVAQSETPPGAGGVFDIAFLDPPYAEASLYLRDLDVFAAGSFVSPDGLVILEHARGFELPEQSGRLVRFRVHPQGDSALSFYQQESQ